MTKQPTSTTQDDDELRPFASPPCSLHEFEEQSLPVTEILELLNALIEGERAGAKGIIAMGRHIESSEINALLRAVAGDEARFCSMLSQHVERLGGTASRATGSFAEKLAKRETFVDKLTLLDRGQSVVVRMLNEAIPRISDAQLQRDLIEMRDVHIVNIDRCNALLPD